ncbi:class I SAM-dependent methyltransferase [Cerasicoccus fimbriatus]|uniref:class I SAM-dependent methyltransferase n=1 Tax=Cerasicoccus fimbriatus TaxID=3014554 RepID=UPI0022B58B6F|nr:class I SAM-dependent methyltransferase [Cerasicoccus sp. TK19100]
MCKVCNTISRDLPKQEAFAEKYLGMLNGGMTMLMISIGHRTGLFDAMADGEWRTSQQLADDAGLNERYVREWLGCLIAAEIVERNAELSTHRLPPEHAHWLSRQSAKDNLAIFAQFLPVLAGVEDDVIDCFRNGGGVPYSKYPRFHAVMAEDSGQSIVPIIADQVVDLFPGLRADLEAGIEVLDIGCGRGMALIQLAEAFPQSHFRGYDLSLEALDFARNRAMEKGLGNVHFEVKDLTHWREPKTFDWITALDAIHDQGRPDMVLANIREALKPGGRFLMQDIDASSEPNDNIGHPLGPLFYAISCMHCMTVSLAQGGMGLGAAWGVQKAQSMLTEAGFDQVDIHRFEHDIQNAYFLMQV